MILVCTNCFKFTTFKSFKIVGCQAVLINKYKSGQRQGILECCISTQKSSNLIRIFHMKNLQDRVCEGGTFDFQMAQQRKKFSLVRFFYKCTCTSNDYKYITIQNNKPTYTTSITTCTNCQVFYVFQCKEKVAKLISCLSCVQMNQL